MRTRREIAKELYVSIAYLNTDLDYDLAGMLGVTIDELDEIPLSEVELMRDDLAQSYI